MASGTNGLAALLGEKRDAVLGRFLASVTRKGLAPENASAPLILDHLPDLLDAMVVELVARSGGRTGAGGTAGVARAGQTHGAQRFELGYALTEIVREYDVLRQAVLAVAKEERLSLTIEEVDVLGESLAHAVSEASAVYTAHRDAELAKQRANLTFLVQAGELLATSLDYRSTLNRVTELIVPRLADWCAVHLEADEEMPLAHVDPGKREVLRELYRRFAPPADAPYGHLHVMRTGKPELVRDVEREGLGDRPGIPSLVDAVGTRSWIIVPLSVANHSIGALTLAYGESSRQYDDDDLVLAIDLARRVSSAIDNARLYDASQNQRARVEAATRAKDEFVAMISHELRTPLNAILGWTRLVRGGAMDEERRGHALEVIERNAVAQDRLVADLLDISKIITGSIRLHLSQVNLGDVVAIAVEGLRLAAAAKRIEIEVTLEHEGALMRADGERLQQVVWNLVANAVKFTPKNGRVAVRLRRVDSDLELLVTDDGEGIPADFLPHVFEIFRQSDGSFSRRFGGLGVGLSITKHLVELHGGTITASSDGVGRGATFVVRLPVSALVSGTIGVRHVAATAPAARSVAVEGASGLRVLVVDDDDESRELLSVVLASAGMIAEVHATVEEALVALDGWRPDVIVSDLGMPDRDGYTLIRTIRSRDAAARDVDRLRAITEGFTTHLAKPVEPAALVEAIVELARDARK